MGNLLDTVATKASLWLEDSFRFLRNFVLLVTNNRQRFPIMMGDSNEELEMNEQETPTTELTKGYIYAVAHGQDTSELTSTPIMSVLSRETGFRDVLQHEGTKTHQKVKLTHLTLVDGDGHQIHARMATHIADRGRSLGEGDIIRLDLFTELTYHVNETSKPMPAILIINYTRVGHKPLPILSKEEKKTKMIEYKGALPIQSTEESEVQRADVPDPLKDPPPECTYDNRLCRKFGVNFIARCICDEIPVKERDLNVIAEDCYLISEPVEKLKMKSKRIMLYWWYATNIYSLRGKGNRGRLPVCLEYAIKAAYPETDSSMWTGYIPGLGRSKHNEL